MSRDLLIQLCGVHSFAFALFHLAFWKLFDWKRDLRNTSFATRAITQILNLRLIYFFLGIGALCFAFTRELHATPLGRALLLFMALFWVGRTIEQFVFLRINTPLVHVLSGLFVLGALLFALPLLA
ncbi:MAG: hypothetical protein EOP92_34085 [Lysobacteraceae bacterium]|nr:MAG: hypothetical protein EOP92_34085 [Xanthomonadaceae bacterium]